ncbi:MAG: magnesium chelatase, partial [Syntrophomonas sp.]
MIPFYKLERYEGNEPLFDLITMSIVSSYVGEPLHVHAEGVRGTGKTTIARAARGILPRITRIKGCIYNCDPSEPHCPQHKDMSADEILALGTEEIPMPFLEISQSAKVGTVAGSIDLAKLTDPLHPEARLLPGLIPQAHRGIIFIDEINRLADTSPEITDILLDVMGNKPGHIQIEEAGLPVVEIPVSVSVWAASNPDEEPGPLE